MEQEEEEDYLAVQVDQRREAGGSGGSGHRERLATGGVAHPLSVSAVDLPMQPGTHSQSSPTRAMGGDCLGKRRT